MKKVIAKSAIAALSVMAFNVTASEFGEIGTYREVISPVEKNAMIEVTLTATTADDAKVYLPAYDGGSIASYQVLSGGNLVSGPQEANVHGRDVWVYQFDKPNADISLSQTLSVNKVYKAKKAKLKYSHPAGVKRVSYEFINSSPATINQYSGVLTVPKGKELYGVVTPEWSKKKKTFDISELNGQKVVQVDRKKLSAADSVKFKIRTYAPSAAIERTLWALVIFLSGALLWKRRGILSELNDSPTATKKTATN